MAQEASTLGRTGSVSREWFLRHTWSTEQLGGQSLFAVILFWGRGLVPCMPPPLAGAGAAELWKEVEALRAPGHCFLQAFTL